MKLDTFAALKYAHLQIGALFLDDVVRRAEDEIAKHEVSCTSQPRLDAGRFGGKHNNIYTSLIKLLGTNLRTQARIPGPLERIDLQHGGPSQQGQV